MLSNNTEIIACEECEIVDVPLYKDKLTGLYICIDCKRELASKPKSKNKNNSEED